MTKDEFTVACVHGRFQPPHLEHLEYMKAALSKVDLLLIGIAQPDAPKLDACDADPHRAQAEDNPFTFDQRREAIVRMLTAEGVDPTSYEVVPFPIDRPDELPTIVPTTVRCFTTIMSDWNLTKIHRLENLGYHVEILWDRRGAPQITGRDIRHKIRSGDATWRSLVHAAVSKYLEESGLIDRMRAGKNSQ